MNDELKWGGAAAIAIAAIIGISSQSGSRPQENAGVGRIVQPTATQSRNKHKLVTTPCADLIDLFQEFFVDGDVAPLPAACYEPAGQPPTHIVRKPADNSFRPKVVIATLPDPLHTHFSLLFDRFVEAIQQGAQDEDYEYDSSWLPWETEEPTLQLLGDQDEADDRKKAREQQPGVLLFRKTTGPGREAAHRSYKEGLVVFIVGEEATGGIHRTQFANAVAWITSLQARAASPAPVAVLGPTFSGSFASLAELLSNQEVRLGLGVGPGKRLSIFSGSTTSNSAATWFTTVSDLNERTDFHSFLQDDDTNLDRFCRYVKEPDKKKGENIAVLSEDETAYGYMADGQKQNFSTQFPNCESASWLYYPRDISTLRAAYQKQSMFRSGSTELSSQDTTQRRSLPTDLADPEGKENDTVRTYSGNQTPLAQEAQLLAIVAALRTYQPHYVVLRSSNTLDPLFLANLLRREYPEGRVVILNSDLLFQRGRDALQLGGVLTLSNYPSFPLARQWTTESTISSHRVFPENSTEATYIASRLLIESLVRAEEKPESATCKLPGGSSNDLFLPPIVCSPKGDVAYRPLPDYAPPFWTGMDPCSEKAAGEACKPATWLSVITRSGSWPLAALNDYTLPGPHQASSPSLLKWTPGAKPQRMPLSMRVFLISLFFFSWFHAWCCWSASFTAKPAFRAHFATGGWRHRVLVLMGSVLLAFMALMAGWACGMFASTPGLTFSQWIVRGLVFAVWGLTGFSLVVNIVKTRKLNEEALNRHAGSHGDARFRSLLALYFLLFCTLIVASYSAFIYQFEHSLIVASRAPVYWRAVNLTSGVSPLVPFLFLIAGLYICSWYSLHGLALFGPDRPRLPARAQLTFTFKKDKAREQELDVLPMFSNECAAIPAEHASRPLSWRSIAATSLIFFGILLLTYFTVGGETPVRSLGAKSTYAKIFCLCLDFCFTVIIVAAWQLWRIWNHLRQLLVYLDRLTLRRTLASLRGFSWGTVWKMSGNVLDVRYKLLSRQLESLNHLHASLEDFVNSNPDAENSDLQAATDCAKEVDQTRATGIDFARWYALKYRIANAAGLRRFENLQQHIAMTAGLVLTHLLIPAWRKETQSLLLDTPAGKDDDQPEQHPPQASQEHIRNAEELACLTYLGFAQNILGRIRTIALAGLFLFLAATFAVSSYPFDPRPALHGLLLLLFVIFGAVIVFVYADMHRDATLSHITNTKPGELGSEFWIKIIGFGAAPMIGLIATYFPDLSAFLFSWLQPGLSSLK